MDANPTNHTHSSGGLSQRRGRILGDAIHSTSIFTPESRRQAYGGRSNRSLALGVLAIIKLDEARKIPYAATDDPPVFQTSDLINPQGSLIPTDTVYTPKWYNMVARTPVGSRELEKGQLTRHYSLLQRRSRLIEIDGRSEDGEFIPANPISYLVLPVRPRPGWLDEYHWLTARSKNSKLSVSFHYYC